MKHQAGLLNLAEELVEYSSRLKPQIKKRVQAILVSGGDAVMDFPANTISQRGWFRSIFSEIEAPHELVDTETVGARPRKKPM